MKTIINFIGSANLLLSDQTTLPALEILVLITLFYAWIQEKRRPGIVVIRGKESWGYFWIAYGIISVILTQIVLASGAFTQHKIVLVAFNLSSALYLCFFNGWSRNKIIGAVNKSKNKKEF